MFPSIHDAVISAARARDHAVCFIIKREHLLKARSDICFEGAEEEIEVEHPFKAEGVLIIETPDMNQAWPSGKGANSEVPGSNPSPCH